MYKFLNNERIQNNIVCRSPNEGKGSRSEAEDSGGGKGSRVDRARRKTVGPLLKPGATTTSAQQPSKQTKNSSPPSTRTSPTLVEPIVEIAKTALVPDLPEGRTLLEVLQDINLESKYHFWGSFPLS